jgi:hypothetical protein
MKKTLLFLLSLSFLVFLAACSSQAADTASADPAAQTEQRTMPDSMKLMLGTVKLDETEYAIDSQQASELLPLWKTLRSLSASETAAQLEVDALVTQIEETMTPEQNSAIEAMNLTMQDFSGVAETLGIETGFGGEMSAEMQATMEAARASGEFPAGGSPGGGMGLGGGMGPGAGLGGAEVDPSVRATAMAERGSMAGSGFGLNTNLLDAIITFLEAKVQ